VTESVYLADLSQEDARSLLRTGFKAAGVTLTEAVESAVLGWGSGHPYWTQLLGSMAAAVRATRAEEVEVVARDLLESEDRNLPHLRRTLSSAPAPLGTMVDRILRGEEVPFGRHDPTVAALELSGVVTEDAGRCAIRTRIYEEVLRQWRPGSAPRSGPAVSPPTPARSISVFVSYAHADERLRVELGKHLAALERQGLISTWHDRMLTGGEEWAGTIDQRLEEAQVILLLVSADFVQSRYCYDVEMKRALERHQRKEALVLPVILRPVALGGLPFAALQALPRDARPVTDWPSLDAALLDVTEGVRAAIAANGPGS
jgi:sirohydrochlorin ferrochelatase